MYRLRASPKQVRDAARYNMAIIERVAEVGSRIAEVKENGGSEVVIGRMMAKALGSVALKSPKMIRNVILLSDEMDAEGIAPGEDIVGFTLRRAENDDLYPFFIQRQTKESGK